MASSDNSWFLDRLDPEQREALESVPEGLLDISNLRFAREVSAAQASSKQRARSGTVVSQDYLAPSVISQDPPTMVRVYRPKGSTESLPALYFMHGGGMVMGSVEHSHAQCEEIVESLGIVVASVEYRLAPETPYPGAMNDCYSGLGWLVDQADALGVDRERVAVGGRSAGAGLAASLAQMVRDRQEFKILFQWLIAPMLDDRNNSRSATHVVFPRVWNHQANGAAWSALLGQSAGGDDVSPYAAAARGTDLRHLPDAFIGVGELDLFLDEDVDYALRLSHAGVSVELHVYPGAFHGSDLRVPDAWTSIRMKTDALSALRRALGSGNT